MDKKIPLSKMIRIGMKVTRQARGELSRHGGRYTCAIGAALTAKRGERIKEYIETASAIRELGVDPTLIVEHPMNSHRPQSIGVMVVITSLNDYYHWSRGRIADWLESIGL